MKSSEYQRADASRLSKAQIFGLAESVSDQLGFEPSGDIHALVEKLGGRVEVQDTLLQDPEQSGSLFVDGPRDFKIVVPLHTSPSRDRFTIAHELGHFVVHYLLKLQKGEAAPFRMMALRKDSDRVEWEANWFAAAFLMPSGSFKQAFDRADGNLDAVAKVFGVSRAAAEVRAQSLGLQA
jgi:predicted transcriptional regulator